MSRPPELRGRAARLARLFPTGPSGAARTPFVLLVVVLLGGGLIGLLVLNSALNAGSFELSRLKKDNTGLTEDKQQLQRDIDRYSSPDALQRRAHGLGMVPGGDPVFLGPKGTLLGVPGVAERSARRTPPTPRSHPHPRASEPSGAPSARATGAAGAPGARSATPSPGATPSAARPEPSTSGR